MCETVHGVVMKTVLNYECEKCIMVYAEVNNVLIAGRDIAFIFGFKPTFKGEMGQDQC